MIPSPKFIDKLEDNQIFVFGSNQSGIHGAGAAKQALKKFGAIYGQGFGFQGKSFAIPTKDHYIQTLPLYLIDYFVDRFLQIAKVHKNNYEFLVTEIGCGLAGYKVEDIAPMFKDAPNNVLLPESFINYLNNK